ncbi:MAG: hypothetical protein KF751_07625 [Nitrospira sp.]|nr:hypothetical protein [Nitrospira sp.]MBX3348968.1 hypothetical protein [Nitrospira sp.]
MDTRNWRAWIDLMPPKPGDFQVTGEVYASNPGIRPELTPSIPQGINPAILMLDLKLVQQPGMWPQVMTWAKVNYKESMGPKSHRYSEVEIRSNGESIAQIKVEETH